jgi:hypothetical protein
MLANTGKLVRFSLNHPLAMRFSSAINSNDDKIKPKKFERTPIGRLEDEENLKAKKQQEEDDQVPRRRLVNPETGEIGGPQVSFAFINC